MHTCAQRLFSISSVLFNATTALLLVISILTFVYDKKLPHVDLKINSLQPVTTEYRGRHIVFNPNIDLTDVFHMNVKQVFLYVRIDRGTHQEMIWSKIVEKNDKKQFFTSILNNYRFFEIDKGSSVTFELRGCIFPFVGLTRDKLFGKTVFHVPAQ